MQMDDKKYTGLQDLNMTRKQNKKTHIHQLMYKQPKSHGGASQVQLFFLFFLQWTNFMGPLQKTVKTIEAPQNKWSYGKMESLPLRPPI
jgi:hypothetical protein